MKKKKILIRQLTWDNWNVEHIAQHNIIPDEVQEVCNSDRIEREGHKQRIFLVGPTKKGRMLSVILEPTENPEIYRPITAYDASKQSIRDYQEETKKAGEAA